MPKKSGLKNENALTLIEMLIVISILAVVMSIAASILIQVFNIVPSSNERMSTRQLAEINLTTISVFIRNADTINTDEKTIIINENEDSKIIKYDNNSNSIKKNGETIIPNIKSFFIEQDSDQNNLYTVIMEKCNTENCEDTVELDTQAFRRN